MSIRSIVVGSGLVRERTVSGISAVTRWRGVPLLLRLTIVVLFCSVVFIVAVLTVSRTNIIPDISTPDEIYLPGNPLPRLPKDSNCSEPQYIYHACVTHVIINLSSYLLYVTFDPNTRMIVRTALRTREQKIGELIRAWGFPTGIWQYGTSTNVYWGKRSATLYTGNLRPESTVEFIQYDFEAQPASAWHGFGKRNPSDSIGG